MEHKGRETFESLKEGKVYRKRMGMILSFQEKSLGERWGRDGSDEKIKQRSSLAHKIRNHRRLKVMEKTAKIS